MNTYGVNNIIRLSVDFTDLLSQTAIDPTEVTLSVKTPDGVVTPYTYFDNQVVRDGVGLYHYDLTITQAGNYFYQYDGDGNIIVESQGGQFQAIPSPIAFP